MVATVFALANCGSHPLSFIDATSVEKSRRENNAAINDVSVPAFPFPGSLVTRVLNLLILPLTFDLPLFADHQKLEREARICRLLKHPNIGEELLRAWRVN